MDAAGSTRARRLWTGVALALASTLVLLGVLEAGVRLLDLDPWNHRVWRRPIGERPYLPESPERPFTALKPGFAWGHRYSSNERGTFDAENSLHYTTNSTGWRGGEFRIERAPGVKRIALLGDSFAFGEGVRYEDTFAGRLPELLERATGCAAEVQNFAVPGHATVDEAAVLEHVVGSYRPDVVVVWYFLNDLETTGTMAFLGENDGPIAFPWLRARSALARLLGARIDASIRSQRLVRSYHEAYRPDNRKVKRMQRALGRMAAWSQSHAVPVLVFVHPILYRLDEDHPFADLHAVVLDACREAGLPAHDLLEVFRGRAAESLWVHAADQHPNEVAHALAAEFAAQRLASLLGDCER